MGYRKTSCIEQICYVFKRKIEQWLEWQEAKAWAKLYHPAWVEIATKSKSGTARKYYKKMILDGYRGAEYGK